MTSSPPIDLLVVDDDLEFRETPVTRFARRGFEVQSAGNGEEALGLAERRNFDVWIFDMMMPGMSGLELLKRFKNSHPEGEVILLTGHGSIETAVEAMKLGAYDYLQKPFPLKDLESLAGKAFERRKLHKENTQLIQRGKVVEVLRRVSGNKSKAARALSVDRRKLYPLLEKFSTEAEPQGGAH
jgi:DNA-binding NtrC family response regulator